MENITSTNQVISTDVNNHKTAVVPAAPTGLSATPGNKQVGLSWKISKGATSYNVKRFTVDFRGCTNLSTNRIVTKTYYTDTSLTNGERYYYVVTAINVFGESANFALVQATPFSIVSIITLFNYAENAIKAYKARPNSQNLAIAQSLVAELRPYNSVTLQMIIPDSDSRVGVYDQASRDIVLVLFIGAENAIRAYKATPSTQNLATAHALVALLQPYDNVTLQMIRNIEKFLKYFFGKRLLEIGYEKKQRRLFV